MSDIKKNSTLGTNIIKGRPIPEHALHFANLAQIASDKLFDLLYGKKQANKILSKFYCFPNNDNSYEYTYFLLDRPDGEIAGLLCGYTSTQKKKNEKQNNKLTFFQSGPFFLFRFIFINLFMSEIFDFIGNHLHPKDYYIQMVSLYPNFRGKGLSRPIMEYAEEIARKNDCERLVLDVDERNSTAILSYKKRGFEVTAKSNKIKDEKEYFKFLRMTKDLTS